MNDIYEYGIKHEALLKEIYTYFKYSDLLDDRNLYNLYIDILKSFYQGQFNSNWRERIKAYYKKVNKNKK